MMIQSKSRSGGFSMIELLVAVLVMGIGVLGITGLQVLSLQNNRAALLRGEAVHLAYDILDRARANSSADYGGLALEDAPPASPNCMDQNCTPAEMAAFDQRLWKCALGGFNDNALCDEARDWGALPPANQQPGLPDGDGAIAVDGDVVTVTVRWQEPNAAQLQTVSVETQI